MSEHAEHIPALMAFMRGNKAEKPSDDALGAAMAAGLVEWCLRVRITTEKETRVVRWKLSRRGQDVLRAHVATLPPRDRPKPPPKRRAKKPATIRKHP